MAITLLYGSLSKNITDIVKGGGCPKIKPPNKKYSVLRYFSRKKDDAIAGIGGVVGDGGLYQYNSGFVLNGIDLLFLSNYRYTGNMSLSGNIPYTVSDAFLGNRNSLNICNQREIIDPSYSVQSINDSADHSICNIERENDVIEKDVDGYYNYN